MNIPLITRAWAMPSKETFQIAPIASLLDSYISIARLRGGPIADPFARNNCLATWTNDIDETTFAHDHMDAIEWLTSKCPRDLQLLLVDPPYSPRQMKECYPRPGYGRQSCSTATLMGELRKIAPTLVVKGGHVITCGWNSNGMGKPFKMEQILLVAHGASHNDTIVTVEER